MNCKDCSRHYVGNGWRCWSGNKGLGLCNEGNPLAERILYKNGETVKENEMINRINVLGIPHKVRYVEDGFRADATHFGEIEYEKAEIRINAKLPDELRMQTLIHEWVHGALVQIGRGEESNDEQLVQGLAVAISQTFQIRGEDFDLENATEREHAEPTPIEVGTNGD